MDTDLAIIGGGPGGYVAAIKAAQLGANVCLIEKDALGGTCLNRGCIPTKALYRNAEIVNILKNINDFGINISEYSLDMQKIHDRKNKVVNQLVNGIQQLLKANGVQIISGTAYLQNKNTIIVNLNNQKQERINAKNIIIATGSKPSIPPIPGINLEGVFTSDKAVNIEKIPEKTVIIGGGVIGMEFAAILNSFGSNVTVLEFLPSILSMVDTEITKRFAAFLKRSGIGIKTSTKVTEIKSYNGRYIITAESKNEEIKFEADTVIVSTGRQPEFDNLNLDEIGIEYDKKGIKVDENYQTNIKGIYAVGDVNGKTMLAHAASHQGIHVVMHLMKKSNSLNYTIPACIFTFPEIAYAGITEDEAKTQGIAYKTSKFMYGANGKALAMEEPEGFVKIVADSDDTILGMHIMGYNASELIHEGILMINKKMKAEEIDDMIFAHPTISESIHEAVLGINKISIHAVNK